jgi:hypothetical protein
MDAKRIFIFMDNENNLYDKTGGNYILKAKKICL